MEILTTELKNVSEQYADRLDKIFTRCQNQISTTTGDDIIFTGYGYFDHLIYAVKTDREHLDEDYPSIVKYIDENYNNRTLFARGNCVLCDDFSATMFEGRVIFSDCNYILKPSQIISTLHSMKRETEFYENNLNWDNIITQIEEIEKLVTKKTYGYDQYPIELYKWLFPLRKIPFMLLAKPSVKEIYERYLKLEREQVAWEGALR